MSLFDLRNDVLPPESGIFGVSTLDNSIALIISLLKINVEPKCNFDFSFFFLRNQPKPSSISEFFQEDDTFRN